MPGHGPRTASGQAMPDRPLPPPQSFGDPPPKKIYHIVQPEALSRVYAAAYAATDTRQEFARHAAARAAVRDFVRLMREDLD